MSVENESGQGDLTELVGRARAGDAAARGALYEAVYGRICEMAGSQRRAGRFGDTLQGTAIANEIYVRFERRFPPPPKDQTESRETFFRSVAQAMREIIRDDLRRKMRRRGLLGDRPVLSLREQWDQAPDQDARAGVEWLALDDVLDRFAAVDPDGYQVIQLRFALGMTIDQTADALGLSPATVKRRASLAMTWLRCEAFGDRE